MYPVTTDPRQNVVLGSSLGGLAAVYLAYSYPQLFGTVFAQTGWFRWRPDEETEHHWLARQLASAPKLPLRFLLQVGNLEVARMLDGGPSQLQANRTLRDTLQSKGYSVTYQEFSGGHDSTSLEFPLAQGIRALFGLN
jgi:enterochelin esterase family protein